MAEMKILNKNMNNPKLYIQELSKHPKCGEYYASEGTGYLTIKNNELNLDHLSYCPKCVKYNFADIDFENESLAKKFIEDRKDSYGRIILD